MDKNTKATLAAAAAAGYVVGRTKKGKLALSVLSLVAGRSLDPMALIGQGVRKLADSPPFDQLGDQIGGQLLDSGRSAVSGMTSRGVESLTSALQERTRSLLDTEEDADEDEAEADETDEANEADDEEVDEAAEEDEAENGDEEQDEATGEEEEEEEEEEAEEEEPSKPRRRPAGKKAAGRKAPSRKPGPKNPPARKAVKTAAAKKAASKKPPARSTKRR
ncbi:hypothetical protein [Streptomyces sp. NBC_01477]|uniref:hypothetical protein n=1 Tax=Streptomyces sp. NBC_01477 TaxID=2976015 RepID=UPI002E36D467|nr:hypothetical protein [Streptomyces sp. NBC_01477]